jgi:hypothetical protein
MPKGMPGEVKPGDLARRIERVDSEIRNEVAAEKFPMLMKALGNLPPTRGEIEMVRLFGYPEGFLEPRGSKKWTKTRTREQSSWNSDRDRNGNRSEEVG